MKKLLLVDQAEIIDELEKKFFLKLENSNILQIFSTEQKNGMITKFEIMECNSDIKIYRI